jgi:hypothetical protein
VSHAARSTSTADSAAPCSRVVEHNLSKPDRTSPHAFLQIEGSYRPADEEEEEEEEEEETRGGGGGGEAASVEWWFSTPPHRW